MSVQDKVVRCKVVVCVMEKSVGLWEGERGGERESGEHRAQHIVCCLCSCCDDVAH